MANLGDNLGFDSLPNQGNTTNSSEADKRMNGEENSNSNWESQAKYFQSEKDKLYTENQNLKKYEKLGHMLEARPDVAKGMVNMLKGEKDASARTEKISLDKNEFDPWEAFNDPKSKSYKFREQETTEQIDNAVNKNTQALKQQYAKDKGVASLKEQLRNKGLNDSQIQSFIDFSSKNPAEYGLDGFIKMWDAVEGQGPGGNQPLDHVRDTQSNPATGGILNGQTPVKKDDTDIAWKNIMNSTGSDNKIP